jgi:hypothetical protein
VFIAFAVAIGFVGNSCRDVPKNSAVAPHGKGAAQQEL